MTQRIKRWTNPSVTALAQGNDPIKTIQQRTQDVVLSAAEEGWAGPPYDPFQLADILGIQVRPNESILDARTLQEQSGKLVIEFNPNRPHGRMRYSIAHEIVHTFFPDCGDYVRNRSTGLDFTEDEWQLELLCNIGAAEILMPSGYFTLEKESITIDNILRIRREFDVSTEALLLRLAKLTDRACTVFAASRSQQPDGSPSYRMDYSIPSRTWTWGGLSSFDLANDTVLAECTAVGYTAKRKESWSDSLPPFNVECVGIPPYPGDLFPRIVGILSSDQEEAHESAQLVELIGDAREPRGSGPKLVAHIVNDKTAIWGGGFALQVRKKWPFVQDDFRAWVASDPRNLALGQVHLSEVNEHLGVVNMVAQKGFGASNKPRLRYVALAAALEVLAEIALDKGATVHMPRIGTGQSGGSWEMVHELIHHALVWQGVPVAIYNLPNAASLENQGMLKL